MPNKKLCCKFLAGLAETDELKQVTFNAEAALSG